MTRAAALNPRAATAMAGASIAAGVVIQKVPSPLTALGLAAGLLVLTLAPMRALVAAAVLATFATRLAFELGGFSIRPEHVITAVLALRLFLRGELRLTARQAQMAFLLSAFLALNVIFTWWGAPHPSQSVSVIGWLALDVLLFVVLCSTPQYRTLIIRSGIVSAGIVAVLACASWILAAGTSLRVGVQNEHISGSVASYVLSYEANTLASSLAIWGVIAVLVRWPSARWQTALHVVVLAAIIAAQTRAALIGYIGAVGLVVLARRSSWGFRPAAIVIVLALTVMWPLGFAPRQLDTIGTKFGQTFDFGSGSGYLRRGIWTDALGDIADNGHYVLGLGANSFGQRHLDATRPGEQISGYLSNLPLAILYDTGVAGLLALFGVLFAATRRVETATWLGVLAVYAVSSSATSIFWFSLTWILLALAVMEPPGDASRRAG